MRLPATATGSRIVENRRPTTGMDRPIDSRGHWHCWASGTDTISRDRRRHAAGGDVLLQYVLPEVAEHTLYLESSSDNKVFATMLI
jgi:hypothetical protein